MSSYTMNTEKTIIWVKLTNGKWVDQSSLEENILSDASQAVPLVNNTVVQQTSHEINSSSSYTSSTTDIESILDDSYELQYINYNSQDEYQSLDILNDISSIKETNKRLENDIKEIKSYAKKCNEKIDENIDYIYYLEKEVARLNQYGCRENVEICGIPESVSDRNLESNVIKILQKIGMDHIRHYDIVSCHRLRKKDRNGNRNTIIRFLNRKDAIACLQKRNKLHLCRELGFNTLFAIENLCPAYQSIFDNLKDLKNNGLIKRVWSYKGDIQFKYSDSDNEKSKKVLHECDLDYYFSEDNNNNKKNSKYNIY